MSAPDPDSQTTTNGERPLEKWEEDSQEAAPRVVVQSPWELADKPHNQRMEDGIAVKDGNRDEGHRRRVASPILRAVGVLSETD